MTAQWCSLAKIQGEIKVRRVELSKAEDIGIMGLGTQLWRTTCLRLMAMGERERKREGQTTIEDEGLKLIYIKSWNRERREDSAV